MTKEVTRQHVRLLSLLEAVDAAGLAPVDVRALHTLAYFANVLAPVWDLPALEGKVLKRRSGPFYPALQHDLDQLVANGMVRISELGHEQDEDGHWRLSGRFALNRDVSRPALEAIAAFPDELRIQGFLLELSMAASAMTDASLAVAAQEDATFGDPLQQPGNVVDFAEWQQENFAANAARTFRALAPRGVSATEGELLHLYVRHLADRLTS